MPNYLLRDSYGNYHFRRRVPNSLRPALKKSEIKITLKTSRLAEAKLLAAGYALQTNHLFRSHMTKFKTFDPSTLTGFEQWYTVKGFEMTPSGPKWEHLSVESAEDQQLFESTLRAAAACQQTTPLAPMVPQASDLITVADAVDKYMHMQQAQLRPSSAKDYWTSFALLKEIYADTPLPSLTHALVRSLRELLDRWPKNRNKMPQTRDLSVAEIQHLDKKTYVQISTTTVNKHLSRYSDFWKWAVGEGYVNTDNPFQGKRKKTGKGKSKRNHFETENLKKIFSGKTWTALAIKRASDYWVPLLALMTGARLSEIVKLRIEDLPIEDGVRLISIAEYDGKTLKTIASKRMVPIHKKLLALGFEDYLKMRQTQDATYLFSEMESTKKDTAGAVGKRFGRYKKRLGFAPTVDCFHSFRHTLLTALSQANINPVLRTELAGHEHATETERTYVKKYPVKELKAAIDAADFEVALEAVRPWTES